MQALRNIGLSGLAVVMVACSDATQPTSTEPAPYEGARVSVTGTSTISFPGLDGKVISATTHEWAMDAIVTNGIAEAARAPASRAPSGGLPVLYMSDAQASAEGPRNQRQIVSFKDSKGNAGDLAFITGDGPVKTMVHIGADRNVDQMYSFEWKKVRGGWLATAFTVSLFKNGKAVGQIRSATKAAAPRGPSRMVAAPDNSCWFDPTCDPVDQDPSGIPGAQWGGAYYGPSCCANELNLYLGAAAGFAGAWQFCQDTGTLGTAACILTLAGLGLTAATLLAMYRSCWRNSPCAGQRPLASIGGTPPPDSFWLPKQYFRPRVVPA